MKEHIYTIPVNDAFSVECECSVCTFLRGEEKNLLDYTLGASMMEPDSRIKSNELGFCGKHFSALSKMNNKLSYALILQTHLDKIRKDIDVDFKKLANDKKSLFSKKEVDSDAIFNSYSSLENKCVICERLDDITEKFIDNMLHMYKKDSEFKLKFEGAKGFCIPHFALILKRAKVNFPKNEFAVFSKMLYTMQIDNLNRIQEDIDWFAKKSDFRFADCDWKNSRDAIKRTVEKIGGYKADSDE